MKKRSSRKPCPDPPRNVPPSSRRPAKVGPNSARPSRHSWRPTRSRATFSTGPRHRPGSEPAQPVHTPRQRPTRRPTDLHGTTGTAEYRAKCEAGIVIAGRYTLQEKIGEGGMGEVWVAKQTEPVKRKVALKLIKPGMDSRAVLQRFEQERQALAMMDHPNIAKVLDARPDARPASRSS